MGQNDIARLAHGVLQAAAAEGVTDHNVIAHAIARNVELHVWRKRLGGLGQWSRDEGIDTTVFGLGSQA